MYVPSANSLTIGETRSGKSGLDLLSIEHMFYNGRGFLHLDQKSETHLVVLYLMATHPTWRYYYEKYKHKILFINPISPPAVRSSALTSSSH